ncbi:DUF6538 domain-containing protein [Roseibium polysiphoniae]|uniref:Tyrosine-type recombinase/integrase n=1 Tax=Roseibium polysiphoniae TaxID=2571221 RepID=A0ABR9CCM4_9HYPH|nr:DUF6538 domain-containing protein [Roseibium polysiphoniae]MBD8876666.1 tyrosine-type recombinase/integrase [Roseibium polysiphoniae]
MRDADRYLYRRGGRWHYRRRVPNRVKHLDPRDVVQVSLNTHSLETARIRRDAVEEADDHHWASLLAQGESAPNAGRLRYEAAQKRALALGFAWKHMDYLLNEAPLEEVLRRVLSLEGKTGLQLKADAEAVLGTVPIPKTSVSEALDVFLTQIAPLELKGKSPTQIKHYTKVKQRAVANFIKVVSDKPMKDISREDAIRYHKWWQDRVTGKKGRSMSASTARRDLGNMRRLYREYFVRIGEENRDNPFRNLNFKERKIDQKEIPPFESSWIRERIFVPDALTNLNRDAALILLVLIETGCRPSELCNITADRIQLDAQVPHIVIDFSPNRAVKTDASVRRIPLIGVSLEAMKRAPKGFPRYRDKETNLSAVLMQNFRKKGLFPTNAHRIYSLRHAFEKRMLEAGLDYGLRCKLMGHSVDRPEYGDGGSLEFRRQELQKIELPFPPDLFTLLDAKPVGKSRTTRRKRVT